MEGNPFRFGRWLVQTMRDAAWAPILVLALHLVASKLLNAYAIWPDLDVPMHFAGGIAIAYFFHIMSRLGSSCGVLGPFHRLTQCLLVFGLTSAAAVGWEFAEFLADRYFGTRMQLGDLNDTLKDLLLGIAGGSSFLVAEFVWSRFSQAAIGSPVNSLTSQTSLPRPDDR
jgi:hypothetical protein